MSLFKLPPERTWGLTRLIAPRERWLVAINADPDALGSAMALRRIIASLGGQAEIGHINAISRPDNLAMIRSLRIPLTRITPETVSRCQRFAIVDSQPHHSGDFPDVSYDVILDHHPRSAAAPIHAKYVDVPEGYGACSSLLTQYLYSLRIRPGKLLATALLYGIKTDTGSFEHDFSDVDVKAFSLLSKRADKLLLRRISHSNLHRGWLTYFSRAFDRLRFVGRAGLFAFVGPVENPDVLVVLADFFLRVHGLSWDLIAGTHEERLVVVMRSDGLRRDMGQKAAAWFGEFGRAGGHKMAARAEIALSSLNGRDVEGFLRERIAGNA